MRENKFKFISTPPSRLLGRENKQIYIHFRLLGRENKLVFVFTPVCLGKKIDLNSFFPATIENIFQAMTGCLAHFPIGMGSYL